MPDTEGQRRFLLDQQIAIVTGAAHGIGRGIAVEMAREGADIVLADVNEEGLDETEKIVVDLGKACLKVVTDVQDTEQDRQLVNAALQRFGRIDILVNNAGINTPGPRTILEVSPEAYDRVLQTNLKGPFFLSQYTAQAMIERKTRGSILFTSSTHARVICIQPAYSASKAALEMFMREIAVDLAEYGIRVNAVEPGWISIRGEGRRTNPVIPLGYNGEPQDVAQAMVFLASSYASYITGQVLAVDGGYTASHSYYWSKKGLFQRPKN